MYLTFSEFERKKSSTPLVLLDQKTSTPPVCVIVVVTPSVHRNFSVQEMHLRTKFWMIFADSDGVCRKGPPAQESTWVACLPRRLPPLSRVFSRRH